MQVACDALDKDHDEEVTYTRALLSLVGPIAFCVLVPSVGCGCTRFVSVKESSLAGWTKKKRSGYHERRRQHTLNFQ